LAFGVRRLALRPVISFNPLKPLVVLAKQKFSWVRTRAAGAGGRTGPGHGRLAAFARATAPQIDHFISTMPIAFVNSAQHSLGDVGEMRPYQNQDVVR
jgi:hypothetical protein